MFDYIGEKIRTNVLSTLPWVSRSAGYTEPAKAADSNKFYPGAMPYDGQPCTDGGDYLNMAPQEGDTALVFVDSDSDVRVIRRNTRFSEIEALFRVVVWYDTRKVTVPGDSANIGLQMALNAGIGAVDFNAEGLQGARVFYYTFSSDAKRIWSRYGMGVDSDTLFMLPYRTFAITYKLTGRFRPECFTGEITADENQC